MVQKNAGTLKKYITTSVIGILVSMLVLLIMTTIAAILIFGERIRENMMYYLCAPILIVASFSGAAVTGKLSGERCIIASVINAAACILLLMSINMIAYDGAYENVGGTVLLILGSSLGAGLLGLRNKTNRYHSGKRTKGARLYKVYK